MECRTRYLDNKYRGSFQGNLQLQNATPKNYASAALLFVMIVNFCSVAHRLWKGWTSVSLGGRLLHPWMWVMATPVPLRDQESKSIFQGNLQLQNATPKNYAFSALLFAIIVNFCSVAHRLWKGRGSASLGGRLLHPWTWVMATPVPFRDQESKSIFQGNLQLQNATPKNYAFSALLFVIIVNFCSVAHHWWKGRHSASLGGRLRHPWMWVMGSPVPFRDQECKSNFRGNLKI